MRLSAASLRCFLVERVGIDESTISDDAPLFSSGIVDSFSMLELITYIEEEGQIRMDPTDVSLDNLDSIVQILSFVSKKH